MGARVAYVRSGRIRSLTTRQRVAADARAPPHASRKRNATSAQTWRHSGVSFREGRGGGVRVERPARSRLEIERVGLAEAEPLEPGPGDHRAVVGAERRCRLDQPHPGFTGKLVEGGADGPVGGDAAGDDKGFYPRVRFPGHRDGVAGARHRHKTI